MPAAKVKLTPTTWMMMIYYRSAQLLFSFVSYCFYSIIIIFFFIHIVVPVQSFSFSLSLSRSAIFISLIVCLVKFSLALLCSLSLHFPYGSSLFNLSGASWAIAPNACPFQAASFFYLRVYIYIVSHLQFLTVFIYKLYLLFSFSQPTITRVMRN